MNEVIIKGIIGLSDIYFRNLNCKNESKIIYYSEIIMQYKLRKAHS